VTKMSGAQAVVEALKRQKVEAIFGIIGGALLPVYDVLHETPEIRHILARHEQCAAHAADGYARASGRPGVCMATSGPGATNLVTGIANAYMDSSPVIAFTGQVNAFAVNSSYMIGKDAFQEADIIGITTPITKYNYQPKKATDIPKTVKQAFHIATTGRPGTVLIDLPKDVQTEIAEMKFTDSVKIRGYKPKTDPHPLQVKKAVELLFNAERPIILAGGGVIVSNASPELLAIAELLMAPVITPLMGKGCFPENHPLSLGNLGMHGTRAATKLILEADVLLAVGTRFSDRTTGKLDEFCPDAKIIHIDIDTAEIGKNVDVDIPIVADAKKALKEIYKYLTKKLQKKESSQWFKRVQEVKDQLKDKVSGGEKDLKPPRLIKELRKILPNDAIVTTEVGQNQMWAALYFAAYKPRTFISSGGLGTMGFGFPASIGAKVACPDRPVVDIAGDGSFRMTEQELGSSVKEKIPVTVIVLNNSMLGMVAQWQRLFYDRRYSAVELGSTPDFVKLAEAYGAQGTRVFSLKEFSRAVRKAIKSDVTTVIDVPIPPEENVFPMIPAGAGLKGIVESEEEL
jgi:acetolactate synthase-1/2/3 large subunit